MNKKFETLEYSYEKDGRKITAVIPKTSDVGDNLLIFSDDKSENGGACKIPDDFIIILAEVIKKAKYGNSDESQE
jgi:hypothetical protein